MFTGDKYSPHFIKSNRWRTELNRILEDPKAQDQERLFLVSFMCDTLQWDENEVVFFLLQHARWENLNRNKTVRNVNRIYERKEKCHINPSYQADVRTRFPNETTREGNPTREKIVVKNGGETIAFGDVEKSQNCTPVGFHVSPWENGQRLETSDYGRHIPEEMCTLAKTPPKTIKVYSSANTKDKWFKVSKKEGSYGIFHSIDSGEMVPVTMADGTKAIGYGWAKNYIGIPDEPNVIRSIITGLSKLLEENGQELPVINTEGPAEEKEKKSKK